MSVILERLQRVEETITTSNANQNGANEIATPACSNSTDSPVTGLGSHGPISTISTAPCSIWSETDPSPRSLPETFDTSRLDATAALNNAVVKVERIRVKGLAAATISENIHIPPELAIVWIKSKGDRAVSRRNAKRRTAAD